MSPAIRHAETRRTTARIVLTIVVSVITTMVLVSGGPIGSISFAQQTTPAPTIQFMNPDNDTSSEVTANPDGVDSAYHLVAWVSSVPENASVQFKYQQSGQQEVTIGTATQTGIPDTFEYFWQKTAMPADGSYTLRAVLFSGSAQVSQDTHTIRINNEQPPAGPPPDPNDTDVPNAVEIHWPTNGGRIGFHTTGGTTAAQIDVTASPDTETVTVYYTTSNPGSDPTWEECGSEDHPDDTDDGIVCELQGDDRPDQVRGIAAVAGDTNTVGLADTDSSDAHRANGYTQDAFSMTLTPQRQQVDMPTGQTQFPCSNFIVAKVFDQLGQRMVRVNVDVHAVGPTDRLAFDDPGTSDTDSSPHKAPDQGTHTTEPEADCEGSTPTTFNSSSQQGEHELSGADLKHIESTTGTTESGEFRFRMASGSSGVTQITAWADEDGNDRYCSQEAHADASISWGEATVTPTGVNPEQTDCPRPTSPATGTQSPSNTSSSSPPSSSPPSSPPPSSPPPSSPPPDPRGCTVTGTDDSETLRGTSGADVICGNGGDDVIYGEGGNDVLYGDAGIDTLVGGAGDDDLHGGDDDDLIRGGSGDDEGTGGAGNDSFNGKSGSDEFLGGGGRDVVTGGDDRDRLFGEGGKDVLKGGEQDDRLVGGARGDVLRGLNGDDVLLGQGGPDSLDGGNGRDRCRGGSGSDRQRNCER